MEQTIEVVTWVELRELYIAMAAEAMRNRA